MDTTKPATIAKDQRYSRVAVIPGKTYLCGCDVQHYTALIPQPHVVNEPRCRVHGQPKA